MALAWRHPQGREGPRPTPRTCKPPPSQDAIRRAGGPGVPARGIPRSRRRPRGRPLSTPRTVGPVPSAPALPPPGRGAPQGRRARRGGDVGAVAVKGVQPRAGPRVGEARFSVRQGEVDRAGLRFDTGRGALGRGVGVRLLGGAVERAAGGEQDGSASRCVVTRSVRRGATGTPVSTSGTFMASGMRRPATSSRRSRVTRPGPAHEVSWPYVAICRLLPGGGGARRISVTAGGARRNSRTPNSPVAPRADIAHPGGGNSVGRSSRRRTRRNSLLFVYGARVNSARPEC